MERQKLLFVRFERVYRDKSYSPTVVCVVSSNHVFYVEFCDLNVVATHRAYKPSPLLPPRRIRPTVANDDGLIKAVIFIHFSLSASRRDLGSSRSTFIDVPKRFVGLHNTDGYRVCSCCTLASSALTRSRRGGDVIKFRLSR